MNTKNSSHSITVKASTKKLSEVRQFIGKHALAFGFDKEKVADIRLAVDEAFTNIIHHAYNDDQTQSVKISLSHNGDRFWISLFDTGKAFSLDNYKLPDVEEKIRQKKRGGVGVYLIQKLMDEVVYRHNGPKNEIRMIKKR